MKKLLPAFQFALPVLLVVGILFSGAPISIAATITSENFGTVANVNVTGWTEGSDGAEIRAAGSGNDSASPDSGAFATIFGDNGYICKTITTTGFNSVQLSYYWRGDSDANNSSDNAIVEFKSASGGNCADGSGWTQLQDHDVRTDSSWSTQAAFANGGFNNTSFLLRFRNSTNGGTGENFRVDGILVSGTAAAPTTTVGDGTSPANKTVQASIANNAVSEFTLSTNSGTDTVTAMVVTGTNTGNVATNGVKIYQDVNGDNEWDLGDTLKGTTSFSGATATFSGLSIGVTTTSTKYLVTYDLTASPVNTQTLTGVVTSATATNSITNSDTVDATITIDTVGPIPALVNGFILQTASDTGTSTSDNITNATNLSFTINFNEAVVGFTSSDAPTIFNAGTATGCAVSVGSFSGTTGTTGPFSFTMTGCSEGTVIPTIPANTVTDNAKILGNPNLSITGPTVTVDRTGATATIDQAVGQTDPTTTSPVNFEVAFGEAVTGFTSSGITEGGTAVGTKNGTVGTPTGNVYPVSVALTGMTSSGTVTVAIAGNSVTDTAGNNTNFIIIDDSVQYNHPTHNITATAGVGGTITPSGVVSVGQGSNQPFSTVPSTGNIVADVLVDGISQGRIQNYTFSNVTATHTIDSTFNGGWSAPNGSVSVDDGGSAINSSNAYSSNDSDAVFDRSNDNATYSNFNLSIPVDATIIGIEIATEGSTTGRDASITLSKNSGGAFTTAILADHNATEKTVIAGGIGNLWGTTWLPGDFSNTNFRARVGVVGSTGTTLSLDQIQVKVYYKLNPTLTTDNSPQAYTGSSIAAVVSGSVAGTVSDVKYNGSSTVPTNAGTYTMTADFAPTDTATYANLNDASAGTFTISKAPSTTTIVCPSNDTYTGVALTPCTAAATGVGGLNQSLTVNYLNNINVGTADASASFAGDANHEASSDTENFTIDKATSTTVVTCPTNVTYTGSAIEPCTVSVTGVGGLNLTPTAVYANNINAGTASGNYAFAGDANHTGSTGSTNFIIDPVSVVVTASSGSMVYGGTVPTITPSYLPAITPATPATCSTTATVTSAVGSTQSSSCSGAFDPNYTFTYVSGSVTVTPASATITANNKSKTYGDANPTFDATVVGTVNGDVLNYSLDTTALQSSAVGDYVISVTPGSNPNYTVTPVDGNLEINAKALTITASASNKVYDGNNTATATLSHDAISGDDIVVSNTGATFSDEIVGTGKTVTVNFTVTGTDVGNYTATVSPVTTIADITAATASCTVTGYTGVYDGLAHGATGTCTGVNAENLNSSLSLGASFTNVPGGTASWTFSNPNYASQSGTASINISKANAIVVGFAYTVPFDGLPHTATGTATGVLGESLSGLNFSGTTHTNAGNYIADVFTFTDTTGNYNNANGVLDNVITKVTLNFKADDKVKVYGAPDPTFTSTITGFIGGDDEGDVDSLPTCTVPGAHTNVGAYPIICSGGSDGNYALSYENGTLTVGTANLNITASSHSMVYGSTVPTITPSYTGLVNGDLAPATLPTCTTTATSLSPVATYPSACSGTVDGNYAISYTAGTVDVTKSNSTTVVTCPNDTEVYTGSPIANCTVSVTGVNGLSLTPTPDYTANTNVGLVTASYTFAGDANHEGSNGSDTFTIVAAGLSVAANPQTKTYGDSDPELTFSSIPSVPFTGTLSRVAGEDIGTYAISQGDISAGPNYTISFTGENLTITARPITVTAQTNTKVYDTNTTASAVPVITSGTLAFTDVANFIESYDNKNVGTGKTLIPNGSVTDGNSGNNYNVTFVNDTTGVITAPSALTITGVTASDKVYDATADATLDTSGATLAGVASGDDVTLSGVATGSFADKNVGEDKAVTITGFTLSGADAGNYSLIQPSSSADITKAPLSINALTDTKVYEGTVSSDETPDVTGLQGFDTVTGLAQEYNSASAGTGKTLSVTTYLVNDENSGLNYSVTTGVDTTGVITPATGTINISDLAYTYDGTAKSATVTTTPEGLTHTVTYNGSPVAPTVAGSYTVEAIITDPNYSGSDTDTLVIAKAVSTTIATCPNATETYTGSEIVPPCTATVTGPGGLDESVDVTYENNTDAGTATATATYAESANHVGSTGSDTFTIIAADANILISNITQTYDGSPKPVTVTANGTFTVTYDGSATVPTDAGTYDVHVESTDANYAGSADAILTVNKAVSTTVISCPATANYTGIALTPCSANVTGVNGLNESVTVDYISNTNTGTANASATYAETTNYLTSTDATTFQIVDNTGPVITAHADVIVEAEGSSTIVNYTSPTATDDVDVSVTVVCVPASGSSFPVGTTLVTCNAQDSALNSATPATFNVIVNDTTAPIITLTGNAVINVAYGVGYADVGATANDIVDGSVIVTVTGDTVTTTTSVGTYYIYYDAVDANGNNAVQVVRTIVVGTASTTVSLSDLNTTYDGTAKSVTATTTPSGLTVDITYEGSPTAPTNAGTYAVVATINDLNYTGSTTGSLVISKADAVISVTPYNVAFDGNAHTALGTATGVNAESLAGLDLSATTHTAVGDYTDTWTFTDVTGNYNDATSTVNDKITASSSVTTITCPTSVVYNTVAQTPCTATVTGAGAFSEPVIVTYSANVEVGTVTASAAFAGNSNHDASSDTATFEITQADTTITITNQSELNIATTVGESYLVKWNVATLVGTPTGTVTVTGGSSCSAPVADGQCSITSLTSGIKTLVATYSGDNNFEGSVSAGATHNVDKQALTVTSENKSKAYGAPDPVFTSLIEGYVDGVDSVLTTLPTCTVVGAHVNVGQYTITCAGGTDDNYSFVYLNFGKLTISDASAPVITLTGDATVELTIGDSYTDAGATALDDVDGDITASIVTTGTVNTAVIGTYTIRYNVSDAQGNIATEVTRTVNVNDLPAPIMTSEDASAPTETTITVTWTTNHPATSRVVYDTVSHPVAGTPANYGYAFSTVEDPTLSTSHTVIVTGLTPNTQYYFRGVSHGSPESITNEVTETTLSIVVPPTDVCPNINDVQEVVPEGYELVEGQCVQIQQPIDVCLNLEGNQPTLPEGYEFQGEGNCVLIEVPVDVCTNLPGNQSQVPEGYEIVNENCVPIDDEEPTDVCPNINDVQEVVPEGYELVNGDCVLIDDEEPTDVCPSDEGIQTEESQCTPDEETPTTATIIATKIVCDYETDLPNWGNGGPDINANTANNFLETHENCWLEPWWFEWAPANTPNPGNQINEASAPWEAFETTTTIPAGARVWVREQLFSDYIPFSGDITDPRDQDVSAEFYCSNDVLNYDNYDYIDPVVGGQTYHCIGFNVPVEPQMECPIGQHEVNNECVDDEVTPPVCADGTHLEGDECVNDEEETPIDVCPNLDGDQLEIPDGYKMDDGQCEKEKSSRGGRGGGSGRSIASTTPSAGQVLGAQNTCGIYVDKFLKKGLKTNDMDTVKKVQTFLNTYTKAGLMVDGLFGSKTEAALKAFQLAHKDKIMDPWGLTEPTGIFYLTTQTAVNNIMCPDLALPIPSNLIPFSQNPIAPKA